jgi:hypothetical protein
VPEGGELLALRFAQIGRGGLLHVAKGGRNV